MFYYINIIIFVYINLYKYKYKDIKGRKIPFFRFSVSWKRLWLHTEMSPVN